MNKYLILSLIASLLLITACGDTSTTGQASKAIKGNEIPDKPPPGGGGGGFDGNVFVTSVPDRAYVYIDYSTTAAGQTPISIGLDRGDHFVQVQKEGYQTYNESFSIRKGKTTYVDAELVPGYVPPENGSLWIHGWPYRANAAISVQLIFQDYMQAYIPEIESGRYWVNVSIPEGPFPRAGWRQIVDVNPGNTTLVNVSFYENCTGVNGTGCIWQYLSTEILNY